MVRKFKWIEWNLQKIESHALSREDVEAAFNCVLKMERRRDGSFQMLAETPAGRLIWVIWRFDRNQTEMPDVFGDPEPISIFVLTAY